ncbi:adenylate cyclase-like protein [Abortiporus biennis]|nr:adenylate cyclase-like protein [Abortiporus biennis]
MVSRPYKIRVYRANGAYHVVSVDLSVTVDELTPQLNKKLLLDPERETHRLYLKERGRERLLALTERPAEIVRRRLDQAGYDVADGLDNLGADDIHFLLKFVYKSNVLGPTEEELHLDNFDNVDLTGRSLKTVPVILYAHAETINSLYLSRNPMLEIPLDFIQSCTSLRVLKLSNMAMKKVPQSVRHCQSLQWLDLSSNRIADLDEAGLDCIPGLRSLKVQNNRMEKLPWYFPKLRSLKELNISNNKFRKLPDVISKTTNLVDLDISFNLIQELPDEIGKLQQLEKLVIVGNKVTRFPPNCSGLENLRTLDCRRNNITDLSVVCLLPKVECILADHNNVFALDLSIGPSLSALDASNNDITQLTMAPGPIGQPYALTSLDISNAKLSSLDQFTLSHLTSLHTLRVCNNSIRSLPETLGDLTQLRHLACSNNQLYTLPSSIGRLQKLEKLEAHNNSLAELPATLWECASLVYLNVTSNLLGAFNEPPVSGTATPAPASSPPNESPLTTMSRGTGLPERKTSSSSVMGRTYPPLAHSLEKLYLGENSLTEDSLHPLIVLKCLKVLNLSFNDIQEIPSGFLKHLPNLEELYLSGNNLSTLPTEDIHRLTDLRVLFLNGNKLQTLPHELGKLKKLTILDVGSNMLKYNINNWEFDWNWNFNPSLRYLNFSGNKRLEIKPDHKAQQFRSHPEIKSLADFSILTQLKVLGLMDVTTTFALNIPDDNEDHRVRTSLSEVNRMPYGIADTLGGNLNMFDLVQPEFRDRKDEAVFALFGRSSHKASSNKLSKYLHDHFLSVFSTELDNLNRNRDERVEDALRRAFLRLNKYLHDFLYDRDPRKPSTVSVSGSSIRTAIDYSSVRSGASGVVMYVVGRKLYVANVGNSLAVISRQGTAELLSTKHDPFDRSETERIRAAEGWVSTKGTVNDEIEVSRSFGFYYLLPVVNARPYISTLDLSELDEFVIIANQGLWDYVPYQTAVDIARPVRGDPMIAAQKLRDFAISYGAEGTTMIMVISVAELFNQGIMRSRQPTADSLIDPEAYTVSRRRPKEIINKDISRLVDEVSPPTGHVALVFTDIRNSTHLWEVNSGMNTAIQMHNHLLRRQLRFCGGYEVKTEGDAFVCSFPTTLAALWWCLSVQLQLLNLGWPLEILECEDGQEIQDHRGKVVYRGLSVRMGIHQGQPLCEPDPVTSRMDYLGPVVNRAARVSGVAAGGQIMCSAEVVREINAAIFETEPPTEHSHRQPSQAVEAIRRMGVVVKPVGEVKLKGLEVSGVLSAVYPADLEARHEIGIVEAHPGTAGSRVQFSIDQMQELALLCIRLETLTRNRIFRPLPKRKGSAANIASDGQIETANPIYLHGNLDVLLPTLDKASDADLMMLLDSLAGRIENALSALTLRQIVALNKGDGGDVSTRRNGGMDVRTLQQLLSFLQV